MESILSSNAGVFDLSRDRSYLASRHAFFSMNQQSLTGIKFDQEAARALVTRIQGEMKEIEDEVEPKLPPRKLNKGEEKDVTVPAKPFKKDGSHSASLLSFLERHGCTIEPGATYFQWKDGSFHTIEAGAILPDSKPTKLGQEAHLKTWLLEQGWKPTYFNTKKDPKTGKPMRDPKTRKEIRTSPKLHEKGKLCPGLDELMKDGTGVIKQVILWLKLRSRLGNLTNIDDEKGWLNDPRLALDGRLSAGSYGLTQSHRQKHSVVRNVPKAKDDVVYGKEFRALFIAPEGKVLVGWDASSLEDRIKGHYTYQFDGGAYARKILTPGYDVHQEAADAWGIPRHTAKNGVYALAYNAGPPKLAETIKCSLAEAEEYHRKYWEINDPLVKLESKVKHWWEIKGNKKWIKTIDGRLIPTRSPHSLVNNLIQSTGAVLFDWALTWLDWKLGGLQVGVDGMPCYLYNGYVAKRVGYFHDEGIMECDPEIADEILELGKASIRAAGRRFKLNVPLESEGSIGKSWADLK
jgi:hypothetical protein